MDFLTGVLTLIAGLGFMVTPWLFRLTSSSLASATIAAGGLIVAALGLGLMRRAPRPRRPDRPRR